MTPYSNVNFTRRLIWLTLFAVAMGFLESAVVIYLRNILYPNGFAFPLAPINEKLAITEFFREIATMMMLISVGVLSGRTKLEKFALFLFVFGIWDIFYYVFLKIFLDWPGSLLTWDILFLIPVTWTGPVLSPIICSVTMIILALMVVRLVNQNKSVLLNRLEWFLLIAGACFQLTAFIWDYTRFILEHYRIGEIWSIQGKKALFSLSIQYLPESFPWVVFLGGEVLIVISALLFNNRIMKIKSFVSG